MKHVHSFLVNLLIIELLTAFVLLPVDLASTGQSLAVGFVTAAIVYGVGDLMIFPRFGLFAWVLAIWVIAFFVILGAPLYTTLPAVSVTGALSASSLIAIAELIVHTWFIRLLDPDKRET